MRPNRKNLFFSYMLLTGLLSFSGQLLAQITGEDLIRDLRWRNIGNANQKGRISSIDALDDDFSYVIVGTASGGVFKSTNAGTTWEPIFDHYGSASIGDVAIFQKDPNIIWVGTGEECGRNSVTWGDGVYKSTDGGKTFTNMGLKNTYTIGSVVTHPDDPDIVYVAATGNIWGAVGDRGLFKTTDGGQTWNKLTNGLPDDYDNTGAIEAVMDPSDPNTLYVSFWERHRTSYRLDSGGPNGGIFKTINGGRSWEKLTNGLPEGDSGKIGLAVSLSNPDVLMAHYEHGFQPSQNDPDYADMTKLGSGIYRSEDGGDSWEFMNRYWSRPFYYNHIAISPQDDEFIYNYTIRFQTSEDGGRTLLRANGGGHCWHALWLDPHNKDRYYVGSDGGAVLTHDGGENYIDFKNINATQYYAIGVDMRDPYYVYGGLQDAGTSGGPSMTRANAIYTNDWFNISGGDGYHVQIDPTDWTTVYSEPHPANTGGRVRRMNVETRQSVSIRPQKGQNIVNYDEYITPEIEQLQLEKGWGPSPGNGSGAFRWNWSTPIVMSPNNPSTIYIGANHLFKTVDQGETWNLVSPDLTKNEYHKTIKESGGLTPDHNPGGGAEFHGTIITIAESPINQDVLWVGTDDGNVQVSRNGGRTWTNAALNMTGLPVPDLWVSRVEASHFNEGTAYVTIDGHRSANFEPWVFKTSDYGQSWTNISGNIPDGNSVYVIKEDYKNPNLLFVGTEFAIFYTLNGGDSWTKFNKNMPTVAIHDLVIHPRESDVIVGTHGRGIWVMDDITSLQQATPEVLASEAHLFENKVATQWLRINPQGTGGSLAFRGENPPRNTAFIGYFLGESASGNVDFEISDITGENIRRLSIPAEPGIGKLAWNMRFDLTPEQQRLAQQGRGRGGRGGGRGRGRGGFQGTLASPGEYLIKMTVNGTTYTGKIKIRQDPMLGN